jgi:hypothetical protein
MSDTEGRDREVRDEPVNEDTQRGEERRQETFKCFVGGISWHLDDHKLKEGELGAWAGGRSIWAAIALWGLQPFGF